MVGTMEEERFARLNHRDSETSLDPTHFRMYSSGVGRWLSPDPLRACPLHPQNFNRYAYVGNSPTNRTDPHGDAVYPGFDYPYIDYGYGYYPPGYGYDEFDYLDEFGFASEYPPYGCDPILGCGTYIPLFVLVPLPHMLSASGVFDCSLDQRGDTSPRYGSCLFSCKQRVGNEAGEARIALYIIQKACHTSRGDCPLALEATFAGPTIFGFGLGRAEVVENSCVYGKAQ
jgi:RHS repeat-associated protein